MWLSKLSLLSIVVPKFITEFFGLLISPLTDMLRFSKTEFSLNFANFQSYHLSESNKLQFSILLKEF